MTVDELKVLITANSDQFQKELNKVTGSIGDMTKQATKSTSGVTKAFGMLKKSIIALGIGKVIKDSISTAMESIESDNLFDVSMGQFKEATYKWSEELSEALGLSAVAVRKNTGTIYNMTTSMGIAEDTALSMAKGVSTLAEDMASFYNIDSATALDKIQSGLTGMGQGLKSLGILVDEDTIKQVAYKNGIAKTGAELTNQQKVIARYVAILQQTKNAHGDLARTLESPANLIRRFKNEISNCANTIGTILMPVVSRALVYINAFVKVLSNALSSLASFLGFGRSNLASTTAQASDNITSLASAMEDADNSAKSIKKSLAGFDEITNLTTSEEENNTGVDASGIPIGFNLEDYDAGLDNIEDKTKKIVEKITKAFNSIKIKKIDFDPITKSLNKLSESLKPFGTGIWNGIKWGIENVLSPLANFSVETAIPEMLNGISLALNTLSGNAQEPISFAIGTEGVDTARDNIITRFNEIKAEISSLTESLENIWDTKPFNTYIGAFKTFIKQVTTLTLILGDSITKDLKSTWDTIEKDIGNISLNCTEIWELFWLDIDAALQKWGPEITKTSVALFDDVYKSAIEPFVVGTTIVINDLVEGITNEWERCGSDITSKTGEAINSTLTLIKSFFDNIIKPYIEPFFDMLAEFWQEHGKPMTDSVLKFISELINGCLDIYNKALVPVYNFVWGKLNPVIELMTRKVSDIVYAVLGTISDVVSGIMNALSGLINFIAGVFTLDWERAWNGLKDTCNGILESLDGIFKGILNLMIAKINSMIRGLNKISFTVPDWVPELGGKSLGFNIKELPKLARGGIVDSPTIAMIGERGKEAVVPLDNNTEWMDRLASKLVTMINAVKDNDNNRPINVTVTSTLNGKVVSKELIRDLNKEAKRLGYKDILTT